MAHLYVIEENRPWELSSSKVSPAAELLTKLETNPFVHFDKMKLDSASRTKPAEYQAYNYAKALANLVRHQDGSVALHAEQSVPLKATLNRGEWRNTVMLATANKNLSKLGHSQISSYLVELAALFPHFGFAEVQTDGEIAEFYDENDLNFVPPCFGDFLSWYHLISPLAYEPYLSREEMLSIPAYRVQEVGDAGWIELVMYEDPLSYASPQTRECIIELTNYINERRHDWTANAARPQKAGVR